MVIICLALLKLAVNNSTSNILSAVQGEGEDVLVVTPGSGAPPANSNAPVTQGWHGHRAVAGPAMQAGLAAKQPTPSAAAADTIRSEVLCFAIVHTCPHYGKPLLHAAIHGH